MEENKKPTESNQNNKNPNNTQPSNPNVNKVVQDAQKSVVNNKQDTKTDARVKKMTSYQEQMLQETTKSKNNKKLVIIIVVVAVTVLAGLGIALAIILSNKTEEPASVACDIRVVTYNLDQGSDIKVGEAVIDEFHFDNDTKEQISYTRAINAEIGYTRDFILSYEIDNTTDQTYTYVIDFDSLTISNCTIVVTNSINDEEIAINSVTDSFTMQTNKDITFYIRIAVADKTAVDENTGCVGALKLSLSV